MKSGVMKFIAYSISFVFVWGAGGISFAGDATEVKIQVSYPSGKDYVSFYNGTVGEIDDSRMEYYVNVHVTLHDENGLPATAGPSGEAITDLTATLTTELGVANNIVEDVFLSDSATLHFDVVDVGPAARAHVKYACQVFVCETGTDTIEVTVGSLTDTAEVEVKAPDATSLVVRTLRIPGAGPVGLFNPITDPSHNADLSALAGDNIYFEVWAVEENGAFTFAPNLEGEEVTVKAYADYNGDGVLTGRDENGDKEESEIATATAEFSEGKATGEIQITSAGTRSATVNALRVVLTAKFDKNIGTTQATDGINTKPGGDTTTDWVSMLPSLKEKLIIGTRDLGDDGNLVEEVDIWYVLDDEASGPTVNNMQVFVVDTYGNPVTQESVTVTSQISGPLESAGVTDTAGGWNIVAGVPGNANPGLFAGGGGADNASVPTGDGPIKGTLTLSDELLTPDDATVWLMRWDNVAPSKLDLHLDTDRPNDVVTVGETVTLYIMSASATSYEYPSTSEIVEYNDNLIIEAFECASKDALKISRSSQSFAEATDEGLSIKAPVPEPWNPPGQRSEIRIPIKLYGKCTKAEKSVCVKLTDTTKGIEDIPLYDASRYIKDLQPAIETRVKISNFSNLSTSALDEDPIVATSRFAVGENPLLDDNDVDTVDAYGNVSNDDPEYGVSSEIGVATVKANGDSVVTYDEDDVGQTDTITVAVAGLEERELQIVTIVESLTATALLCSREGPAAALNSGEVILKIKANGNTAENREIQVAIDTDNSVEGADLRDFSGVTLGTSSTYTLNAGTPVDEVLRLVVSAPAAGNVVVQAGDITEGVSELLDTGSITIPFTELEHVPPTASIAPEEGSSVSPASSIVITVKDNYGVSLKNTVYSIKKDGSDITRSLTCGNAGEGTKEGTITCGKEPVGAAYSWGNMAAGSTAPGEGLDAGSYVVTATPKDLIDNTGSKVTSNFTVAVCTPVVTIDPASALLPLGGTQQFSASTSCDGTSPAGTYTWDIMTLGCTGSTISSSGLYTAPDSISGTSCTDTVRVTDTANGNATATAEVTVSEITTTTTSTDGNAVITVIPDPMLRSRWVMIPVVMRIQGENTNFTILQSRVSFSPSNAVVPMPRLVVGKKNILQLIFVNPPWLAGGATDGTLEVTVTTGSEEVTDTVNIQMLPLGLDK